LQTEANHGVDDWLLMEAGKGYDTIDLADDVAGQARRKHWKALRDQKRNTEKMITTETTYAEKPGFCLAIRVISVQLG